MYIRDLTKRTNESFFTIIGLETLVFDGELECITQSLEYASRVAKGRQTFLVYANNQESIVRLYLNIIRF